MKVRTLAAVVALVTLGAAAPADEVAQVQGVYREAFTNHMADGEPYRSVDEIRIVRGGPAAADVTVHLEFRNGHTCDFDAATRYEAGVFSATTDPQDITGGTCAFSLAVLPEVLKISAKGAACFAYCGARGNLDGAQLKRSSRRPLRRRR